jgi:hypothetical protein
MLNVCMHVCIIHRGFILLSGQTDLHLFAPNPRQTSTHTHTHWHSLDVRAHVLPALHRERATLLAYLLAASALRPPSLSLRLP